MISAGSIPSWNLLPCPVSNVTATITKRRLSLKKGLILAFYRYFEGEVPSYLSRHFWWAYMWRGLTWFFDHPVIISSILFGQYKTLKRATIERVARVAPKGRMLQLTCVYGRLTPRIMEHLDPQPLHEEPLVSTGRRCARGKMATAGTWPR